MLLLQIDLSFIAVLQHLILAQKMCVIRLLLFLANFCHLFGKKPMLIGSTTNADPAMLNKHQLSIKRRSQPLLPMFTVFLTPPCWMSVLERLTCIGTDLSLRIILFMSRKYIRDRVWIFPPVVRANYHCSDFLSLSQLACFQFFALNWISSLMNLFSEVCKIFLNIALDVKNFLGKVLATPQEVLQKIPSQNFSHPRKNHLFSLSDFLTPLCVKNWYIRGLFSAFVGS